VSVDYFAAGVMAFECMFGRVSNFYENLAYLIFYRGLMLERRDRK